MVLFSSYVLEYVGSVLHDEIDMKQKIRNVFFFKMRNSITKAHDLPLWPVQRSRRLYLLSIMIPAGVGVSERGRGRKMADQGQIKTNWSNRFHFPVSLLNRSARSLMSALFLPIYFLTSFSYLFHVSICSPNNTLGNHRAKMGLESGSNKLTAQFFFLLSSLHYMLGALELLFWGSLYLSQGAG